MEQLLGPDVRHLLVARPDVLRRYEVPYSTFPTTAELHDWPLEDLEELSNVLRTHLSGFKRFYLDNKRSLKDVRKVDRKLKRQWQALYDEEEAVLHAHKKYQQAVLRGDEREKTYWQAEYDHLSPPHSREEVTYASSQESRRDACSLAWFIEMDSHWCEDDQELTDFLERVVVGLEDYVAYLNEMDDVARKHGGHEGLAYKTRDDQHAAQISLKGIKIFESVPCLTRKLVRLMKERITDQYNDCCNALDDIVDHHDRVKKEMRRRSRWSTYRDL